MKKMIVFAAALVAAVMSQAAQLDWNYAAADANDVGKTVYVLLGNTAQSEWESLDVLKAASLSSGAVDKSGRNYLASGMVKSGVSKDNANIYYVIVAKDEKTFDVTSVSDMTASVYDPAEQESSPGQNVSLNSKSIAKSGLAWGGGGTDPVVPTPTPDVPEPTSGLLLLVGGAALALRRKQK